MRKVILAFLAVAIAVGLTARSTRAFAQSQCSVVHKFDCPSEGCKPTGPDVMAQGRDGNLYATMTVGGEHGNGTIVGIIPTGSRIFLYSFDATAGDWAGANPEAGLTLGLDGYLYGGVRGPACGAVFKIGTTDAEITPFHHFLGYNYDGCGPASSPILAKDKNYYGATGDGYGHKITPTGVYKNVYLNPKPYGRLPNWVDSPLLQASDGYFYGTNAYLNGTLFRFNAAGNWNVAHTFIASDGSHPNGQLVQSSDAFIYGVTATGGNLGGGTIYKYHPTKKTLSTIHWFPRGPAGYSPEGGLVEATDGYLYGSTKLGGSVGAGTIFRLKKDGSGFNYLCNVGTGSMAGTIQPQAALIQHTNGKIYGLSNGPHYSDGGALYEIDMGLSPFVRLMSTSGTSGQTVQILGQGFVGTSTVRFGAGSAAFSVISDTFLTAKVPVTGTTGLVSVTTPGGNLTSNAIFKVTPTLNSFTPASGSVGSSVLIVGTALTQTTKVTFGGIKAAFTIKSATQITAIVPVGAMTGKIAITTPGGTVSKSTFTVI